MPGGAVARPWTASRWAVVYRYRWRGLPPAVLAVCETGPEAEALARTAAGAWPNEEITVMQDGFERRVAP